MGFWSSLTSAASAIVDTVEDTVESTVDQVVTTVEGVADGDPSAIMGLVTTAATVAGGVIGGPVGASLGNAAGNLLGAAVGEGSWENAIGNSFAAAGSVIGGPVGGMVGNTLGGFVTGATDLSDIGIDDVVGIAAPIVSAGWGDEIGGLLDDFGGEYLDDALGATGSFLDGIKTIEDISGWDLSAIEGPLADIKGGAAVLGLGDGNPDWGSEWMDDANDWLDDAWGDNADDIRDLLGGAEDLVNQVADGDGSITDRLESLAGDTLGGLIDGAADDVGGGVMDSFGKAVRSVLNGDEGADDIDIDDVNETIKMIGNTGIVPPQLSGAAPDDTDVIDDDVLDDDLFSFGENEGRMAVPEVQPTGEGMEYVDESDQPRFITDSDPMPEDVAEPAPVPEPEPIEDEVSQAVDMADNVEEQTDAFFDDL